MSTDRELLELAAKACGLTLEWDARGAYERIEGISGNERVWNPLTDDGDALRLAVKLRLNIDFTQGLGSAHRDEYMQVAPKNLGHLAEFGPLGDDPAATIRRAIVVCAAEIEKANRG